MAESTLAYDFEGLNRIVAEAAGYGHIADASEGLSSSEVTEIKLYVDGGYREFLNAYEWSFTQPLTTSVLWKAASGVTSGAPVTTTITATASVFYPTMIGATVTFTTSGNTYTVVSYTSGTVIVVDSDASGEGDAEAFTIATTGEYRLPDNFGGLVGNEIYFASNDGRWLPIECTGLAEVAHMLQTSTGTARPTMAALQPLAIGTAVGQRFALLVWRIPDADYTIKYQYYLQPDSLTTGNFPYGGAVHTETIKYACLAKMDLMKFGRQKGYEAEYQKLLAQSIRHDKRFHTAPKVGFSSRRGRGVAFELSARNITVGGESFP